MQSQYYKNMGSAQRYYDQALRCFQTHGRTFPVGNLAETGQMVQHILADHPEIFYVGQRVGMRASLLKAEAFVDYTYSPAEVTQITIRLEETADSIIREQINDYQSDYDKVRALHDYLKCNLEYDVVAASSANLNDRNIAQAHSIVGALLNHKCVCDGFSKALKYLCDRISVECWVVCGSGNSLLTVGPHAWNIVKINGYYHHVDVTWDNQYSDSAAMPNYGYFNLSDEEISKDHTWERRDYPVCPSSPYNYFRVNDAMLDSQVQLERFLYNSFQNEETYILFRVVRGSLLEQQINGCISQSVQRAAQRCKYLRILSFSYSGTPEQLTYCISPEYEYR